jgi:hypothetical protein
MPLLTIAAHRFGKVAKLGHSAPSRPGADLSIANSMHEEIRSNV